MERSEHLHTRPMTGRFKCTAGLWLTTSGQPACLGFIWRREFLWPFRAADLPVWKGTSLTGRANARGRVLQGCPSPPLRGPMAPHPGQLHLLQVPSTSHTLSIGWDLWGRWGVRQVWPNYDGIKMQLRNLLCVIRHWAWSSHLWLTSSSKYTLGT